MNYKVSVVVPVYKVESYIHKCLDTIMNQDFTEYEVVLVDDGSPDSCGEICEKYASGRQNVKVIHQSNQGLSAARNNGVVESSGEYILFVDSDDYISADCVSFLYSIAKKHNADISIAKMLKVWNDDGNTDFTSDVKELVMGPGEALKEMCYTYKFGGFSQNKLYRRELVERYPYPVGRLYEDIATTHKIMGDAQKIVFGNKYTYFYRQSGTSIMRSKFNPKQLDGLEFVKEQLRYIEERYPEAKDAAIYKCAARIHNYMYTLLDGSKMSRETYRMLRSELKQYLPIVLRDRYVKKSFKIRCITIMAGYIPMKYMCAITNKMVERKYKRILTEVKG